MVDSPRRIPLLVTLAVLALLLFAWWQTGLWYERQLTAEQRAQAALDISLRASALSAGITRRLARLQGLRAMVATEVDEPTFESHLARFAADLYADTRGIRHLAVAPGAVVRYVYPLQGNEAVLGYEPLRDPRLDVRGDVLRAVRSGDLVMTGPVELIQGGQGLIARQAVSREGQFWGLVSIVFDLPSLLAEAALDAQAGGFAVVLRRADGQVIYGDVLVLDQNPVISPVDLPAGAWELAAVPTAGWQATVRRPLLVFQGAGLIIVGLVSGLVYLSVNRQARLQQEVRARTYELLDLNRQLREAQQSLEQRVEERTRQLSALLEVSRTVASTPDLVPLLGLILEQLKVVVDYSSAGIVVPENGDLVLLDYRGPIPREQALQMRLPQAQAIAYQEIMRRGQPVLLEDAVADTSLAQTMRELSGDVKKATGAWLGVPLIAGDETIGLLSIDHAEAGPLGEQDIRLAVAFANQAAVAMENALLYRQAQQAAVLAERQRLARELHDSVSQALYGIGLGVRTARELLEQDPARAVEPLDYALSLASAGLAEMRALLFELRPESLAQEGLVAALRKQADALQARHGIDVQVIFCDELDIPLSVKEALFRVAQEALHNAAKHAQAHRVDLHLAWEEGVLRLEVRDDGRGFDPDQAFPGHLGLRSMQERMDRIGGTLQVESRPGRGTSVRAQISCPDCCA